MLNKRYIACVCRPQYVNGPPTGPSVGTMAPSPVAAALQVLAEHGWEDPGYVEVLVYMDPQADDPQAGKTWRVRVALEPER